MAQMTIPIPTSNTRLAPVFLGNGKDPPVGKTGKCLIGPTLPRRTETEQKGKPKHKNAQARTHYAEHRVAIVLPKIAS